MDFLEFIRIEHSRSMRTEVWEDGDISSPLAKSLFTLECVGKYIEIEDAMSDLSSFQIRPRICE